VSDHLEIRWDIDTEAQDKARELGIRVDRIEMPNDDPRFVRALAEIVRGALVVPSRTLDGGDQPAEVPALPAPEQGK
jgi:hypothetical protein